MNSLILLCAGLGAPALLCADAAPSPTPVTFVAQERPRDEYDRLTLRLERQARELREDVLVPFRNTELHPRMVERVQEIERLATVIHRMVEREGRTERVREVLERLDEQFRHLDRHVDDLGRLREIDRRAYNRLRDDLRDMRETLHRLRREL
jgi:hypothetical protein